MHILEETSTRIPPMPIKFQKFITRQDLRDNPNSIYVFGDNLLRTGMGGQAAEMRGEPNAYGIPTKFGPGGAPENFFNDLDFHVVEALYDEDFYYLLEAATVGNKVVVFPLDGLGTGLADLPNRAPEIFIYLELKIRDLRIYTEDYFYEDELVRVKHGQN